MKDHVYRLQVDLADQVTHGIADVGARGVNGNRRGMNANVHVLRCTVGKVNNTNRA